MANCRLVSCSDSSQTDAQGQTVRAKMAPGDVENFRKQLKELLSTVRELYRDKLVRICYNSRYCIASVI